MVPAVAELRRLLPSPVPSASIRGIGELDLCPQRVYSGTYVEPLVINDRCLKLSNRFLQTTEGRRESVERFQSRPSRADAPRPKGLVEGALELLVGYCGGRRP